VNARGVVAPQNVKELAQSLEDAGYETWCVGGAVRDALLGMSHLDWDLATAAPPQQVIDLFGRRRTVPVGIKHGTVGVRDRNGLLHEWSSVFRLKTTWPAVISP
jgi:tRNA nucleotidyltransferase (CCA-adding enzyme)